MGSVEEYAHPATMKSLIILAFLGVVAVESFTDEDHHHEKDNHDDGHAFGFKAVFQPRAHRFVRSAEADAGYGGYGGYGGLGGFGGFGGLGGYGGYGGIGLGYGHGYKYGHSYGGYGGHGKRSADSGEDNIESDRRIAEADPEADAKAGFGLGGYGLGGLGGFGFGGLGGYGLGGLGLGYGGYGGLGGLYGGGLYGRGLYGGYGLW